MVEQQRVRKAAIKRVDEVTSGRRKSRPPELTDSVILDCEPPLTGIVERVDIHRELAYVRTRYGTLPYGFSEIRRAGRSERKAA